MGLLRFCLALSVVSTHTSPLLPFRMINGIFAVKIFFIISGFYMALILNEKYYFKSGAYKLFITNRILRLYPLYLIIFIVSLLLYRLCAKLPLCPPNHYSIAQYNPYTDLTQNIKYLLDHWGFLTYTILSNLFILGLDWVYFLKNACFSIVPQVIPQAWTLSLEFYFYFMAPVLVRQKTIAIIFLSVLSFYIKTCFVHHGDPDRFFPSDLLYFLLGILSYRIYTKIQDFKIPWYTSIPVLVLLVGLVLGFQIILLPLSLLYVIWNPTISSYLYPLMLLLGLPIIFSFTKNNSFDRWIGEFSYPIYISHFAVIYFAIHILHVSSKSVTYGWQIALISFILSFFLLHLVYPIEKMRLHRVLSHKM